MHPACHSTSNAAAPVSRATHALVSSATARLPKEGAGNTCTQVVKVRGAGQQDAWGCRQGSQAPQCSLRGSRQTRPCACNCRAAKAGHSSHRFKVQPGPACAHLLGKVSGLGTTQLLLLGGCRAGHQVLADCRGARGSQKEQGSKGSGAGMAGGPCMQSGGVAWLSGSGTLAKPPHTALAGKAVDAERCHDRHTDGAWRLAWHLAGHSKHVRLGAPSLPAAPLTGHQRLAGLPQGQGGGHHGG